MASILRSPQALQLTLALIKPDAVAHPLILEAVHQQILSNKFLIVRMRELLWRKEDCQRFYREHEGPLSLQGVFSISGWWNSWPAGQSEPTSLPTRMPSSYGGRSWDPPECSEHATWPQIPFVGVSASPIPATPPTVRTLWFQPAERLQPSSLTSVNSAGMRRKSPSCAVALCAIAQREVSTM
ncbi:nucleoside diphosphate kinase 6 isoform X3 [Theropithecus gelada]|uniref:nucleoside diphosphate kinase 6 isoform X3 n=1 Tax=Theropithecus gelada TaxID=9565 RepID=UPI000DC17AAC|nr:nucleoside diphosphate kinase 6 isoform X3 [Theropithecus gelada]